MISTAYFTELLKWTHFLVVFFLFPQGEYFKAFLNFGKGRVIAMYLPWQKHYYYFTANRDLFVRNKNYPFRYNLKLWRDRHLFQYLIYVEWERPAKLTAIVYMLTSSPIEIMLSVSSDLWVAFEFFLPFYFMNIYSVSN